MGLVNGRLVTVYVAATAFMKNKEMNFQTDDRSRFMKSSLSHYIFSYNSKTSDFEVSK